MIRRAILTVLMLAVVILPAAAKNIDLVTLPKRQSVQLTIYNSADLTLVKETRFLTFKKGTNRLQFAWSGTLIDPTSIELRPLEQADKIEVVSTIFPGQKPQHLIWNVDSKISGMAKVEVSYFISGLTWKMDYVATCNPQESALRFRGHVRVFNNSGEEFDNAEIRLIVGKINLVEKIAALARRYGIAPPKPGEGEYDKFKGDVSRRAFKTAAEAAMPGPADMMPTAPKKIVKEGLSEYFMFSVPGTETIANGWSKRMQAMDAPDVKFDIVHRVRGYQYGPWPVRFFIFTNDKDHKLGDSPLPDGKVRIFRENGRDGLAFLAEQKINYVPIKAKAEINLGADRLVVYKRRRLSVQRKRIVFRHTINPPRDWVKGWDEVQTWNDELRNYTGKPLVLELHLRFAGDVEFASEADTKVFDYQTIETKLLVPAGKTRAYPYTVTFHNGSHRVQNRVKLVGAP